MFEAAKRGYIEGIHCLGTAAIEELKNYSKLSS